MLTRPEGMVPMVAATAWPDPRRVSPGRRVIHDLRRAVELFYLLAIIQLTLMATALSWAVARMSPATTPARPG